MKWCWNVRCQLYKTKTDLRLSWWPTPQDYNEAVQIPQANLYDPELKSGLVYTDAIGLPRPVTGSFASVYRMHCPNRDFALRLFLRNIHDQAERYALISDFVQHDDLPYTVTFDFLQNGIKIMGEWLPALKMEWVEGEQFDDYIVESLGNPAKLGQLLTKFLAMMDELRQAGIAHGDLQHGNIIMCGNELRLVDYDGMFVPAMNGYLASELGHRNYQHPQRAAHHFGPYLDNFSAWVIYASVRALQIDSRLMHKLGGGDDCLLFRQADFVDPLHSAAFSALENHNDVELNTVGRFLRAQLEKDPANVPYLHLPVPAISDADLEPISQAAPGVRSGPRLMRGNLPDWLQEENAEELVETNFNGIDPGISYTAPNVVQQSWTVPARPAQAAQWVKPSAASQTPITHLTGGYIHPAAHPSAHPFTGGNTHPQVQPSPSASPPAIPLPPELSLTNTPRTVTFFDNCGRTRPEALQWAMIFNPAIWIMFGMFSTAFTSDNDLRVHGVDYTGTVTNVSRYQGKGPHTNISLEYNVGGVTYTTEGSRGEDNGRYRKGQHYMIRALPANPNIKEPLEEPAGTKQSQDIGSACLCFLINLLCELGIWLPALKHKRLARNGVPLMGTIDNRKVTTGSKGEKHYSAMVHYFYISSRFSRKLSLSEFEFNGLTNGPELILCDPNTPTEIAVYKYCRYHPIIPPSPAPSLTPLSSVQSPTNFPAPSNKSLPRP